MEQPKKGRQSAIESILMNRQAHTYSLTHWYISTGLNWTGLIKFISVDAKTNRSQPGQPTDRPADGIAGWLALKERNIILFFLSCLPAIQHFSGSQVRFIEGRRRALRQRESSSQSTGNNCCRQPPPPSYFYTQLSRACNCPVQSWFGPPDKESF